MTTDYTALIAELRGHIRHVNKSCPVCDRYGFAADAIEKLEAERDFHAEQETGLREDIGNLEQERDAYAAVIAKAVARLDDKHFVDDLHVDYVEAVCDVEEILVHAPADVLAARDRRVAAKALREAADDVSNVRKRHIVGASSMGDVTYEETRAQWTYQAHAWLTARAERVDRQQQDKRPKMDT